MSLPPPPEALFEWSQIFAGVGSIVLTIFLVILYRRQKEQLAANHEAVLEVTDYEWDGDDATIYLSNYGNGVAKEIGLVTLVHVDTGHHRRYVIKSNQMKRQDKRGEWSNVIEPGEEEIEFAGKLKVGEYMSGRGFVGISFSAFVRRMKEQDATEIKYQHAVQGVELSGNGCYDKVYWVTRAVDPQDFEIEHSLGNLPRYSERTNDTTFWSTFHPSRPRKIARYVYARIILVLNWFVPKIRVEPRSLDASGRKRVKRVVLRHKIKRLFNRLRKKAPSRSNSES